MPEGDTIFRAARTLDRALGGKVVTRFVSVLPRVARTPDDSPVAGRTIAGVTAAGKHLLMRFSGDLVLHTHMRMNGSWHIYRPGEQWRKRRSDMRILLATADFEAVAFNVHVASFETARSLLHAPGLSALGPDLLAPDFDEDEALARFREHSERTIADALLNQRLAAGIGNVYKSEVLFLCGVNPCSAVRLVADSGLRGLLREARRLLRANVAESSPAAIVTYTGMRRTTRRADPSERLWVYGRAGKPCRKCGTPIQITKQGADARSTYWCPTCQPPSVPSRKPS